MGTHSLIYNLFQLTRKNSLKL